MPALAYTVRDELEGDSVLGTGNERLTKMPSSSAEPVPQLAINDALRGILIDAPDGKPAQEIVSGIVDMTQCSEDQARKLVRGLMNAGIIALGTGFKLRLGRAARKDL
jgi:hypothetical protein